MLDAAQRELHAAGVTRFRRASSLADAGYWHQQQMERDRRSRHPGADPARRQEPQRHPARLGRRPLRVHAHESSPPSAAASSTASARRSSSRSSANTKFNRGIDRFRRRGRAAVRAEWRLITATHNLLKLHRHATRPPDGRRGARSRRAARNSPLRASSLGDRAHADLRDSLASRRQRWCATSIRSAAHARPHCAYARDATASGQVALRWVVAKRAPRRHRLRTPALMRERGAECRKRIPIRTDRLR